MQLLGSIASIGISDLIMNHLLKTILVVYKNSKMNHQRWILVVKKNPSRKLQTDKEGIGNGTTKIMIKKITIRCHQPFQPWLPLSSSLLSLITFWRKHVDIRSTIINIKFIWYPRSNKFLSFQSFNLSIHPAWKSGLCRKPMIMKLILNALF